jgi:hypothetical protein
VVEHHQQEEGHAQHVREYGQLHIADHGCACLFESLVEVNQAIKAWSF